MNHQFSARVLVRQPHAVLVRFLPLLAVLILLALIPSIIRAQDISKAPGTFKDYPADPALKACTDFHTYACEKWEQLHPIPADRPAFGTGAAVSEWNRAVLRDILEAAAKGGAGRDPIEQRIGDYYAACLDEAAIEKAGLAPIQPELKRIAAMKSKKELAPLIAHLHLITSNIEPGSNSGAPTALFGYGSIPDFDDAKNVVGAFDQGGIGLPDRDYYFRDDEKSKATRAEYTKLIKTIFVLAGESKAQAAADAKSVLSFETELARHSMDIVKRRDPKNLNNKRTLADLQKAAPHFDWDAYLTALGSPRPDHYLFFTTDFLPAIDSLVQSRTLAGWKTYLRWNLLNLSARHLPKSFVQARFEFYAQKLAGTKEQQAPWKRCSGFVDRDLGEAVGHAYVARTFPPSSKQKMLELVHALEQALDEDIASLDWMSEATKQQAHLKVKAILDKIGYPDQWRDYTTLTIARDDTLGNAFRASTYEVKRDLAKIGKPRSRTDWGMTPATVDAYYNGLENTINFPAGILQPPFFDANADDALNFGAIGVVIGHELTHGFDDQGRKFDAEGNLRDWWTAEDGKKFDERAKCISDEYGGFVAIDDVHVNGQLTLGENTADNGGLRIALRALHNVLKAKGRENELIDGLTPDQRFFLAYAHVWCATLSPQILRLIAQTNPHSPPPLRINGVVSNMPEFREAFSCKAGELMVRDPACRVW